MGRLTSSQSETGKESYSNVNMNLAPYECSFVKRVKFLGHIYAKKGVISEPEKTVKVMAWPIPSFIRDF